MVEVTKVLNELFVAGGFLIASCVNILKCPGGLKRYRITFSFHIKLIEKSYALNFPKTMPKIELNHLTFKYTDIPTFKF